MSFASKTFLVALHSVAKRRGIYFGWRSAGPATSKFGVVVLSILKSTKLKKVNGKINKKALLRDFKNNLVKFLNTDLSNVHKRKDLYDLLSGLGIFDSKALEYLVFGKRKGSGKYLISFNHWKNMRRDFIDPGGNSREFIVGRVTGNAKTQAYNVEEYSLRAKKVTVDKKIKYVIESKHYTGGAYGSRK